MNYPLITIIYGLVIVLLGVISYFVGEMQSLKLLITPSLGVIVLVAGILARSENWRKHAMHAASLLSLLAILVSWNSLIQLAKYIGGDDLQSPQITVIKSSMAILSLAYVILCSKAFIDARIKKKSD